MYSGRGARRSSRIDHEAMEASKAKREELERKTLAVLKKRQKQALKAAQERAAKGGNGGNNGDVGFTEEEKTIEAYESSDKYPRNGTLKNSKIKFLVKLCHLYTRIVIIVKNYLYSFIPLLMSFL